MKGGTGCYRRNIRMKVKWGKQGTAVLATAVLVVGSLAPVSASGETTKSDKTIQNVKIDHVKV